MRFFAIRWILKDQTPCPTCQAPMAFVKDASKQLDGLRWRCCIHQNDKISVSDDSWLADSRLSSNSLLWLHIFGQWRFRIIKLFPCWIFLNQLWFNISNTFVMSARTGYWKLPSNWMELVKVFKLTKVCSPSVKTTEVVIYHNGRFLRFMTLRKRWGIYERYQIGRQLPYCR